MNSKQIEEELKNKIVEKKEEEPKKVEEDEDDDDFMWLSLYNGQLLDIESQEFMVNARHSNGHSL